MISVWVGFMVEKEIVNRYYLLPRWLIFSVKMIDIISTRITLRVLEYLSLIHISEPTRLR